MKSPPSKTNIHIVRRAPPKPVNVHVIPRPDGPTDELSEDDFATGASNIKSSPEETNIHVPQRKAPPITPNIVTRSGELSENDFATKQPVTSAAQTNVHVRDDSDKPPPPPPRLERPFPPLEEVHPPPIR